MTTPRRRKVEVDLQKFSTPTARADGGMGVQLPPDLPIHLRCFRLEEDVQGPGNARPVKGLTGWTAVFDVFTFGVKIYLRVGRDGTLRVFAEDETGREMLAKWEK